MNKNNNFDFLRFLFALFVVISHSFPLSGRIESEQWIYKITNGQIVLAQIGLTGFFVISGFFIFKSLERSKNLKEYLIKRFLRLFPALFFVLLFSVILALFVYTGNIPFLKNKEVYTYLPNNLTLYGFQSGIKGVFEENPYHAINGSLWTIKYEFTLYIALMPLAAFTTNRKIKITILSLASIFFLFLYNFYLDRFSESSFLGFRGGHILNLGTFFIIGSLLSALNFENVRKKQLLLITVVILILISLYFGFYNSIKHILFSIAVLLIGYIPIKFFKDFGDGGDPSYGIYIYSFPVQQTLMFFFNLDTYPLIIISVIVSITFGYLSWHIVEKKALSFKNLSLKN